MAEAKTCKRGHLITGDNALGSKVVYCRSCSAAASKRYYHLQGAGAKYGVSDATRHAFSDLQDLADRYYLEFSGANAAREAAENKEQERIARDIKGYAKRKKAQQS